MERIQKTITERLHNNLPADLEFIDPQWLGGFGIPGFVVERINFLLHKKLHNSVQTPSTDWADMDAKSVRATWNQFIVALEAEKRLPAAHAKSIIEAAVEDVLRILVEPRKNLPDYLFGNDKTLDFKEASERAETIMVYNHFGHHLPNYMRRKQLDFIDRERFSSFISQLDDKLTAQYNPLNWSQLLNPLFELNEQLINPELLARFFRDKNRNQLAELFDHQTQKVSPSQFIEILSSPRVDQDSTSVTIPDSESMPVKDKIEEKPAQKPTASDKDLREDQIEKSGTESGKEESITENKPTSEHIGAGVTSAVPPASASHNHAAEPVKPVEPAPKTDSEPAPLWQRFRQTDPEESTVERESIRKAPDIKKASEAERGDIRPEFVTPPEPEPEQQSADNQRPETRTEEGEDLPLVERFKTEEPDRSQASVAASADVETSDKDIREDPDTEHVPMWKRFITAATSVKIPERGKSDEVTKLADSFSSPDDDYELDIEIGNPLRIDEIKKTLDDKKKYYIKRFFKGDQAAFNTVIRDLAEMESWKEAGPYITKNVFKKNKIDPYSDEAVNFVDRLQSYFNAYSK